MPTGRFRSAPSGYLLEEFGRSRSWRLPFGRRPAVRLISALPSPSTSSPTTSAASAEPPRSESLTPRQREILRLVAEGVTTKAIARRLGISVKTVEAHRTQMMDRLDIHDVPGLVRYAIRVGLVGPEV